MWQIIAHGKWSNELLRKGIDRKRFLWVSFDYERLVRMNSSEYLNIIIETYVEMYSDIPLESVYMLFEEIQLIEGWKYFEM